MSFQSGAYLRAPQNFKKSSNMTKILKVMKKKIFAQVARWFLALEPMFWVSSRTITMQVSRQGLGVLPCFFWQGEELDYYHFTLRIIVLCQAKRKGVYLATMQKIAGKNFVTAFTTQIQLRGQWFTTASKLLLLYVVASFWKKQD